MRAVAWKKLSPVAVTHLDISFWTKYWIVKPIRASQRTPGPHMRAIRGHMIISPIPMPMAARMMPGPRRWRALGGLGSFSSFRGGPSPISTTSPCSFPDMFIKRRGETF